MLKLKDISIIIPTYNRCEDLKKTLNSFYKIIPLLREVIIIDQSQDDKTKDLIKKIRVSNLRYFFSKIPSITLARNRGIKNVSKLSKIIIFLDDDVDVKDDYFNEILRIFNKINTAKAVAVYERPRGREDMGYLEIFLKKIFFLGHLEKENARIISAYGNTYPKILTKVTNVQWFPGANMAYQKEFFNEQKFDDNLLGYTLAEDIDFTYRLYKKYPLSIFMTPFAKFLHRASKIERYPTEKMAYINQIDHFYFNFKNLDRTIKEKVIFAWSILGISILRVLNLILRPTKINNIKLKFYFKSIGYCLTNLKKIKKGKLRDFE